MQIDLTKVNLPNDVLAVFLFGSTARGDSNVNSDIDLCVVCENLNLTRLRDRKKSVAAIFDIPEDDLSIFTRDAALKMASAGSLFIWHLKQEGKVLFDRANVYKSLVQDLPEFDNYAEEIDIYKSLLSDVRSSLSMRMQAMSFDLHVLQVVVRNTCILLSSRGKTFMFSRRTAYESAKQRHLNFPINNHQFDILEQWHLYYTRNVQPEIPLPSIKCMRELLHSADMLTQLASEVFNANRPRQN